MGLAVGDKVDRYEVLELLGAGGMGEVYRARDPKLERHIALKILHPDGIGSKGGESLLREARAVAALSHPNVLAVYDAGEVHEPEDLRGLCYLAMELVIGSSLRASMRDAATPVARRIEWLRDVARGLQAAHEVGIMHRDVKPENVMIRFDGVVKVLDFGIARRTSVAVDAMSSTMGHSLPTLKAANVTPRAPETPLTTGGAFVGTPFYMSPEQLRGGALDGRTDQFSWGVMAYEVLTRAGPWQSTGNGVPLIDEILHDEPKALRTRAPDVPEEVAAVIERAMAKRAEDRFATMGELIEALAPFVSDAGVARSSGSRRSGARAATGNTGRHARRLATGGVIAALAISAGVALVGRSKRAASPPSASSPTPATAGPVACLPEAKRLYDEGLVAYETTANARARRVWMSAAAVDPACAPAQLRVALSLEENGIPLSDSRAAYIAARDHEDHLTDVEREIAEATLPHFAADPSDALVYDNLRAVGERHPQEPFVFFLQGVIASDLGRADDARAAFERTIAVRPKYQTAYALLGYLAKTDEERAQWSARCLAETPHSTWCHALRADDLEGGRDCAAYERFARDYVATDPGPGAQVRLTEALLATGAPREAVLEANRLADDHSGGRTARNDVLFGDYAPMEKWIRENADAKKPDFASRAALAYNLSVILDDTGRRAEADALVRSTYLASRAMSSAPALSISHFYDRAVDAGAITRAEAARALDESGTPTDPEGIFRKWIAIARLSRTAADARDALAKMPPKPTLSTSSDDLSSVGALEADLGRLYALAGDWPAARREAEAAVTRCDPAEWALGVVRAYALLGSACEKTGDLACARGAYETVIRRWGTLAPRPVHAELARARLAALGR